MPDGIEASDVNINISGNAKVIATGATDGIYAKRGNITINGNAKVTAAGGGCDGIHVEIGNITIAESAEVTATVASEGDYGIYVYNGNITINGNAKLTATGEDKGICVSEGDITISDNANVTAMGKDEGIYTLKGNIAINGSAVVKAAGDISIATYRGYVAISDNARVDAAGNMRGIYGQSEVKITGKPSVTASGEFSGIDTMDFSADDTASINALVFVIKETLDEVSDYNIIAYGKCEISAALTDEIKKKGANTTLTVKEGAVLTNKGSLQISDFSSVELNGKIINNGEIILESDGIEDPESFIKSMGLTGTGTVRFNDNYYKNDGTPLDYIENINLSDEEVNLPDGCAWDEAAKTLTLKDTVVGTIGGSITGYVTINVEGTVKIDEIGKIASNSLTITGNRASIDRINNYLHIIFKNTTAVV